jgi:hypothetical protein
MKHGRKWALFLLKIFSAGEDERNKGVLCADFCARQNVKEALHAEISTMGFMVKIGLI